MRISDWSSDVCSSDLVHVTDRYVLWVAPYRYRSVTWSSSKLHRCIPMARKPQTARPQTDQKTARPAGRSSRSEEPTSELQSLMRISYAVFCLKKKKHIIPRLRSIYL